MTLGTCPSHSPLTAPSRLPAKAGGCSAETDAGGGPLAHPPPALGVLPRYLWRPVRFDRHVLSDLLADDLDALVFTHVVERGDDVAVILVGVVPVDHT